MDNIDQYLKIADLGVISSKSEGLPVCLLEFGSSGIPVVATNVGDINIVLKDGKRGVVVPPKNYNKLADGILRCLENKRLFKLYRNKITKAVMLDYSSESFLTDYNKILNIILTKSKNPDVLYLGNMVSGQGLNPQPVERLGMKLGQYFKILCGSSVKNQFFRLCHMQYLIFNNRFTLKSVIIDTRLAQEHFGMLFYQQLLRNFLALSTFFFCMVEILNLG